MPQFSDRSSASIGLYPGPGSNICPMFTRILATPNAPLVPLLISSGYGPGKSIYYHLCNQYFYDIIKQPIY